jgi:hypothetical protein
VSFSDNILDHAIEISEHILRAHPQRPHTLSREPPIPRGVPRCAKIMAQTINFDAQLRAVAIEIENVRARRVLAPETETCLLPAQGSPKESLGQ